MVDGVFTFKIFLVELLMIADDDDDGNDCDVLTMMTAMVLMIMMTMMRESLTRCWEPPNSTALAAF